MNQIRMSWNWLWLSLAALAGMSGSLVWRWATFDNRVPVTISRAEVLNSPIFAGQPLWLRTWRDKVRDDCKLYSTRTAMDEDGAVITLPDYFGPGGPVGTAYAEVGYQTLISMHPGDYWLQIRLTFFCPGVTFDVEHPTMPFRIEARVPDGRP